MEFETAGEQRTANSVWRSLGFYTVSQGQLKVVLKQGGPGERVADAVMIVDDWTYTTPKGSFTTLDHGELETPVSGYNPQPGTYTLLGKRGDRHEFDVLGLMTDYVDRNRNRTEYEYTDADGGDGAYVIGPTTLEFSIELAQANASVSFNLTLPDWGGYLFAGLASVDQFQGVFHYTWDFHNRLTKAAEYSLVAGEVEGTTELAESPHQVTTFSYDVVGNRIGKSVRNGPQLANAQDSFYLAENGHLLLEFDEDGQLTTHSLFAPAVDQLLATDTISWAEPEDPELEYLIWALTDHQGTVRDVYVTHNGGQAEHVKYTPFGAPQLPSGLAYGVYVEQRFAGREYDEETNLYYNRARYYYATSGRFLSEDPLGFGGGDANLYRYVRNSPLNGTDPSGAIVETPWDWFSLVVSVGSFTLSLESALAGEGSWWDVGLDGIGVVADGAAILLPGVPGGAGVAINGWRALSRGQKAVRAIGYANDAANVFQTGRQLTHAYSSAEEGDAWGAGISLVGSGLGGTHLTRRYGPGTYSWIRSNVGIRSIGGNVELHVGQHYVGFNGRQLLSQHNVGIPVNAIYGGVSQGRRMTLDQKAAVRQLVSDGYYTRDVIRHVRGKTVKAYSVLPYKMGEFTPELPGHEVFNNRFLEIRGIVPGRGIGWQSRRNPAIAIPVEIHASTIQALQRKHGVWFAKDLDKLSRVEIISRNLDVLREAGIAEEVVQRVRRAAVIHARRVGY